MNPMLLVYTSALVGGIILTPVARSIARRWNIVDHPDGQRKMHQGPTPLCGGVSVFLAVMLALVVVVAATWPNPQLVDLFVVLLPVAGFVCFFGCLDDRFNLSPRSKLVLQVAAALPIVLAGYYIRRIAFFGYTFDVGWIGIPLTMFWLVGCINALNLLDGMDGLASVVGISSATMIAIIAAATGQDHVAVHAVALAGALTAFLLFNLPPASIFLGDSGSMVIGLVLGILALQSSLKSSATLAITIPAVIMTIPMLDSFMAVVRRRLSGGRVEVGDRGHIHHRLLERGFGNWKALCVIGALCLATGAAAAAASVIRNDALAWIVAISVVVLLVRLRIFGHHELALVKLSVANRLSHLAHRMTDSARAVTDSAVNRRTTSLDDSWNQLLHEISTSPVDYLDFQIANQAGTTVAHRQWNNSDNTPAATWNCVLRFSERDGRSCEFTIRAANGIAQPSLMYQLTVVLSSFGKLWMNRDELFQPTVLSMQPSASQQTDRSEAA